MSYRIVLCRIVGWLDCYFGLTSNTALVYDFNSRSGFVFVVLYLSSLLTISINIDGADADIE